MIQLVIVLIIIATCIVAAIVYFCRKVSNPCCNCPTKERCAKQDLQRRRTKSLSSSADKDCQEPS